ALPFNCSCPHPALHSFPTRRSSDLTLRFTSAMQSYTSACSSNTSPSTRFTNSFIRYGARRRLPLIVSFVLEGSAFTFLVAWRRRSEEHTSELQSQSNLVCRLLLEKK